MVLYFDTFNILLCRIIFCQKLWIFTQTFWNTGITVTILNTLAAKEIINCEDMGSKLGGTMCSGLQKWTSNGFTNMTAQDSLDAIVFYSFSVFGGVQGHGFYDKEAEWSSSTLHKSRDVRDWNTSKCLSQFLRLSSDKIFMFTGTGHCHSSARMRKGSSQTKAMGTLSLNLTLMAKFSTTQQW